MSRQKAARTPRAVMRKSQNLGLHQGPSESVEEVARRSTRGRSTTARPSSSRRRLSSGRTCRNRNTGATRVVVSARLSTTAPNRPKRSSQKVGRYVVTPCDRHAPDRSWSTRSSAAKPGCIAASARVRRKAERSPAQPATLAARRRERPPEDSSWDAAVRREGFRCR
jgi:hypothetical protein